MLAGVGGRTVAEAKRRLSHREALAWREYVGRRGSLNTGRRVEYGVALLAMQQNRINGGKARLQDFLLHEREPEPVASIQGLQALLQSKSIRR